MKRAEKVRRVACPECEAVPGARCADGTHLRDANHLARIRAHQHTYPPIPRGEAPAGVLAWFDGQCSRCDGVIQRLVHQVVQRKSDWIHVTCAPGQEDAR